MADMSKVRFEQSTQLGINCNVKEKARALN